MSDTDDIIDPTDAKEVTDDQDSEVEEVEEDSEDGEDDDILDERGVSHGEQYIVKHQVPKDERKTSSTMTIAEFARVVAQRATEIDNKSPIYVDRGDLVDAEAIARKEVYERQCPVNIIRDVGRNRFEEWEVNEMSLPPEVRESYGV
jgi:DNA-directed RNA polymerase subunit K/omega